MTDWKALAARFESADETTIYECVRDLIDGVWPPASAHDTVMVDALVFAVESAETHRLPILLLGPVAACMPEGWRLRHFVDGVETSAGFDLSIHPCVLDDATGNEVFAEANSRPAALAAAICRAYGEMEREKANDAA